MSVKWATSMRVFRLNSLEHFMKILGYIHGQNEHNHKNELCSKRD